MARMTDRYGQGGTVTELLTALRKMRELYPYDEARTYFRLGDPCTMHADAVSIETVDAETGIEIAMRARLVPEDEP